MARKFPCSASLTARTSFRSRRRRMSNGSWTAMPVRTRAGWAPTPRCRGPLPGAWGSSWRGARCPRCANAPGARPPRGWRVIELSARVRDPETQVVLARLNTPLAGVLHAAATGGLAELAPLAWHDSAAVTVVLAAEGYPGSPRAGDVIDGIDAANDLPGVHVLHAGTAQNEEGLCTAGGRVLSVVGAGSDLAEAREAAYAGVREIRCAGMQHRADIADQG